MPDQNPTATPETITLTQLVSAPRGRVCRAFLEPDDLMQWFHATDGWITPHATVDARAGGAFSIGFRGPDAGQGFDFVGIFDEILEPQKITYTIADGRKVWITFSEDGDQTKVTLVLTLEKVNTPDLQRQGWGQMLANLAKHVEK